jgi:hypothetical protein
MSGVTVVATVTSAKWLVAMYTMPDRHPINTAVTATIKHGCDAVVLQMLMPMLTATNPTTSGDAAVIPAGNNAATTHTPTTDEGA